MMSREFRKLYANVLKKALDSPEPLMKCETSDPAYSKQAEFLTKLLDHQEREKMRAKLKELEADR